MIFGVLILIIVLLTNSIGSNEIEEEEHPLLWKVERWILYSIHRDVDDKADETAQIEWRLDDFLPPEHHCHGFQLYKEFVARKCYEEKETGPNGGFDAPHNWDAYTSKLFNVISPEFPHSLGDAIMKKQAGHQVPKWAETMAKIDELIGWKDFGIFRIAEWPVYFDELASRCAEAGIDLAIIKKAKFYSKMDSQDNSAVCLAIRLGQQMAEPMLHMVLYRTLRRAIGDIVPLEKLGGMARATMTSRDLTVYKLVHEHNERKKLACHEGMARRDYVEYWLQHMYNYWKQFYAENHAKFLRSTTPKPENSQETQNLLKELAKYVPYWDKMLETVEKHGVQELDPTIDLFGPSVEGLETK